MTEAHLIVQYKPERKDYIQASRTLAMKSGGFIIISAVIALVMAAAAVVLLVPTIGDATWRSAAVILLLTGVFYFVYLYIVIPLELSRTYKSNENLQKERRLTFSDSGVEMQVADQITLLEWEKIKKVVRGKSVYLLIYRAEERIYPILPVRAFETEGLEQKFLNLLEEKNIPTR